MALFIRHGCKYGPVLDGEPPSMKGEWFKDRMHVTMGGQIPIMFSPTTRVEFCDQNMGIDAQITLCARWS